VVDAPPPPHAATISERVPTKIRNEAAGVRRKGSSTG
jgi:hypothetical protein